MARIYSVNGSVVIAADAESLYDHVSDPTRMGQSSPENVGASVVEPRDGAYVGMVFDGHNKRGAIQWTTRCKVTAADPGKLFAFRVVAIGLSTPRLRVPIASWEYRFDPTPDGTRVTETWTDDRRFLPDLAARGLDKVVTGGHTFAEFQRGNIDKTLAQLKQLFEQR